MGSLGHAQGTLQGEDLELEACPTAPNASWERWPVAAGQGEDAERGKPVASPQAESGEAVGAKLMMSEGGVRRTWRCLSGWG